MPYRLETPRNPRPPAPAEPAAGRAGANRYAPRSALTAFQAAAARSRESEAMETKEKPLSTMRYDVIENSKIGRDIVNGSMEQFDIGQPERFNRTLPHFYLARRKIDSDERALWQIARHWNDVPAAGATELERAAIVYGHGRNPEQGVVGRGVVGGGVVEWLWSPGCSGGCRERSDLS